MVEKISCVILLFISLLTNSHAQSQNDLNKLYDFVINFTEQVLPEKEGEEIIITPLQLDKSMAMPTCNVPIQPSLNQQGLSNSSNVVTLQCPDLNKPWTIQVPVQIQRLTKVLSANRLIKPGEIIAKSDISTKIIDINQQYQTIYQEEDDIIGLMSSRVIASGSIFSNHNLKRLPLVHKKQKVDVILRHGTIEITMRGTALSNGYFNDEIKVMNPKTRKVIEAKVSGQGQVKIEY